MNKLVSTTYNKNDVKILLKDLTGTMEALDTESREKKIQSGVHYSEMLPLEYKPTEKYIEIYNESLKNNAKEIAEYTSILARKLYAKHGSDLIIISLARAGIPIGILVKRYIKYAFDIDVKHYSISIIRGKGIDINAMNYIYNRHLGKVAHFQFLDGWTGKGAINMQLKEAVNQLKKIDSLKWRNLSSDLAVLADPAGICSTYGTQGDILIPSSCLNSTVSGLVSRTILRDDLVDTKHGDFHGGVYFGELKDEDKSIEFIDTIQSYFSELDLYEVFNLDRFDVVHSKNKPGIKVIKTLIKHYDIKDINLIKPGIGETTRVLLRRLPWKVVVNPKYKESDDLKLIYRLCEEKHVDIEEFDIGNYKACGIIKDLSADA